MGCGRIGRAAADRWHTVCHDPGTSGIPSAGPLPAIAGSGPSLSDSHPRTRLVAKIRGTVNTEFWSEDEAP